MPPPSSVASVRAICDVANLCRLAPMPGSFQHQPIELAPLARLRESRSRRRSTPPTTAMMISRICARTNSEMPTMMRVDSGSCALKLL